MIRILIACVVTLAFPLIASAEQAIVVSVVDGDTLRVRMGPREERVRLIGIDTPEKQPNQKAFRDAARSGRDLTTITRAGQRSMNYLSSFVRTGMIVKLEFDIERRDRYKRLLAYVYLPDGTMVNERLLKEGYAQLLTYPPNVRHVERFRRAVDAARNQNKGLWSEGPVLAR